LFSKGRRAALTLKYVTAGNFVWDDHLANRRDEVLIATKGGL
jgi:hypothetical protein